MTTSLCPTMQTVILQRDEIPVRRPHLGHDRPRFLSWLQVRAARHPMPSLLPLPTWWSVSSSRTPDDYFTMITASHSFTCCRHVTWRELPHSPRPSDFCGRPAPAKYGHRRLSAEDGAYYRGRRLLSQKYHYRISLRPTPNRDSRSEADVRSPFAPTDRASTDSEVAPGRRDIWLG